MSNLIEILDVCTEPNILKVILFIKTLLKYILFIIPMGLIVMISIDFAKNVIAGNVDNMKKNLSIAIKRIIYCLALFLVPTIVSTAMSLLGNLNVNYATCITNAESSKINEFILSKAQNTVAKLEKNPTDYNLIEAKEAVSQVTDKTTKNNLEQRISVMKEQIDAQKESQKEETKKPDAIIVGPNGSGGNSSQSSTVAKKGEGLWVAHQKNSTTKVDDAIKEGFWGIEVDVWQSGDIFKLYHDSVNEPYNGYNLDAFLDTCKKNNITPILDLKSVSNYETLISQVKAKGMEKKTIYQTSVSAAKTIHEKDNNARVWVLISDSITNIDQSKVNELTSAKDYIEGVNMRADHVDANDIKAIQDIGLTICSFSYIDTLYPNADAKTLRSWGTNYIMANNIDE